MDEKELLKDDVTKVIILAIKPEVTHHEFKIDNPLKVFSIVNNIIAKYNYQGDAQ